MPSRLSAKTKNRILHLHIGCGKTGSSALQLWLAQNAQSLSRAGILYPLFNIKAKKLGNYSITSGNGVTAVNALQGEDCESFFESLLKKNDQILLSSETFQTATVNQLRKLKDICDANDVHVNIIVYLRDLYASLILHTFKALKDTIFVSHSSNECNNSSVSSNWMY